MVFLRSTPINISIFKKNMSSSTFEVKEQTASDADKVLDIDSEEPDENGLELITVVDGEVSKDHNYTKEPTVDEEEEDKIEELESDVIESSPKKKGGKGSRGRKPSNVEGKGKNEPVKKESPSKRGRKKADDTPEDSTANGEEDSVEEAAPKVTKRGRKRKVEEKENVIDESILEEVQNITEDSAIDREETAEETPKKKKAAKEETSKAKRVSKPVKSKEVSSGDVIEDRTGVPKGWVKKLVVRKSGKTAGTIDIYIYSPEGLKFRSKPDVVQYLAKSKSSLKIDDFDFSKEKAKGAVSTKSPTKAKSAPTKAKADKKKAATVTKKNTKVVVKIGPSKKKKDVKTKSDKKDTKETKSTKAKGNKRKKN